MFVDSITQSTNEWSAAIANGTASTTAALSACNPLSGFDIGLCLGSLFVPNRNQLSDDFDALRIGVFQHVPWGYVNQFYLDFSTSTPVEPPALTYTFGSSSPAVLQGKTYSMQIFDYFGLIGTVKADDGSNKNIWDIFDPFFQLLVNLAVVMVVISDVIGLGFYEIGQLSSGKGRSTTVISTPEVLPGGKATGITHIDSYRE